MNSRIRRKQIREAVARFRARRAAAAAAQSEAVPVTPVEASESAGGLPVSEPVESAESLVEASLATPAEPAAVAPRLPRYWTDPDGRRMTWIRDLSAVEAAYRELSGEALPDSLKTRCVGDCDPAYDSPADHAKVMWEVVQESRAPKQLEPSADPIAETAKAAKRRGCSPADVEWWRWERDSRDFYVPVVAEFDPAEYAARRLYSRVKPEPSQPVAKPESKGEQVQLGWGSLGNHVE